MAASAALPTHAWGLTTRYLGSEVVVLTPTGAAHALTGPVATVWRAADPAHCDAQVRHALGELSDDDVATAVIALMDAGLVVPRADVRSGFGMLDRRALLHRAGAVGGVTVGAYLTTLLLPSAAMATSGTVLETRSYATQQSDGIFAYPTGTRAFDFTIQGAGGGGATFAVGGSGATYTGTVRYVTPPDGRSYEVGLGEGGVAATGAEGGAGGKWGDNSNSNSTLGAGGRGGDSASSGLGGAGGGASTYLYYWRNANGGFTYRALYVGGGGGAGSSPQGEGAAGGAAGFAPASGNAGGSAGQSQTGQGGGGTGGTSTGPGTGGAGADDGDPGLDGGQPGLGRGGNGGAGGGGGGGGLALASPTAILIARGGGGGGSSSSVEPAGGGGGGGTSALQSAEAGFSVTGAGLAGNGGAAGSGGPGSNGGNGFATLTFYGT